MCETFLQMGGPCWIEETTEKLLQTQINSLLELSMYLTTSMTKVMLIMYK